ncbi:conserved hypothetical protein [Beutenbergia cavernae DSM 12333]|uniref:ATP-binding region ATPase domain protein n=1 Tax=Beutenbergia cavernae (strain ATCC BAA-8 / DSM 12333 / CCUG 43141 / JCM 11478 / NBRC 16432 / NCIMB 13614 / HKI 0122) TaxID=471853 RepID=C5BZD9_BEUC1|nr:hypothetical protein [Beutenbergia cavernae]ACQ79111.1 conserved hypothetical protein [Beutenbergia cavernae DSM 12333]
MSAPDPFRTAELRAAALTAWTASPRRLREDANLEDDVARGQYADRVVVELLQNAADAAARARTAGAVLLELTHDDDGTHLRASNTGAPLTPDGVAALASMRTSDKGLADEVGRFGVGFAAVRAVADAVVVASCDGAVRFDVEAARDLLTTQGRPGPAAGGHDDTSSGGALVGVLDERGQHVPALRLPFADATSPAPGYTTTVDLLLRGPDEVGDVVRQLDELDDALLLALPRLASVTVRTPDGERRLADVADRWWTRTVTGTHPLELLATRPAEERSRRGWSVTWAVPRDAGERAVVVPTVIHAPTPTENRCTLPALLIASFPVEPSRRRLASGPLADAVAHHAGDAYAAFVADAVSRGESPFDFVPAGLPSDEVDGALREAAVAALARTPVLAAVTSDEGAPVEPVAPRDAVALTGPAGDDPALLRVLSRAVGALVPLDGRHGASARALGVTVRDLAGVLDDLRPSGDPTWWRELADVVEPYAPDAAVGESLATLPVPLVGGGFAHGPRGLVVLDDDAPAAAVDATSAFAPFGMRVVHPEAAHPLLVRLGAGSASAVGLLGHDAVRAALASLDADPEDDPATAQVQDAVLALADAALAAGVDPTRMPPGLGDLPLPTASGGHARAAELVLPSSRAEELFAGAEAVAARMLERWGAAVLGAVGVRSGLRVAVVPDVLASDALIDGEDDDGAPEGWAEYLGHVADHLGVEAFLGDLTIVEDLEEVADDAWGLALADLASTPALRGALVHEVRGAGSARAPSYASWWLRDRLGAPFAVPGARVAFLPDGPAVDDGADVVAGLDPEVLRALGGVRTLDDLDAAGWDGCLDALPDAGTQVPLDSAVVLWRALAGAAARGIRLPIPPERVVLLDGGRAVVADATSAVVADEMTGQLGPHVPAARGYAEAVAQLLDVEVRPAPAAVVDGAREDLPGVLDGVAAVLLDEPGGTWVRAETLAVGRVAVRWWVDDGDLLARDEASLARALAYAGGEYAWHAAFTAALAADDDGVLVDLARARPRLA